MAGAPIAGDSPATEDTLSVPATRAEAEQSLQEVEELFSPMTRSESRSLLTSGGGRDATMALRDLAVRMGALSSTDKAAVDPDAFSRPWGRSKYSVKCRENICVHWISSSRYSGADVSDDEFAFGDMATDTMSQDSVLGVLVHVSSTYRKAGFRLPARDGSFGGDGNTDVYLKDIGAGGKYGYCTVDVNGNGQAVFQPSNRRSSDLPAFCVLDNDYTNVGFEKHSPLENLQVTAAHEYFHAVQFAYDFLEDRWFMEATATWAEDEVYPRIDDNLQYLRASQLRFPGKSLDNNRAVGGMLHYGDWIFFRYLTERLPARKGELPVLMLQIWQRADSVVGPDRYSIQAVAQAVRARGVRFPRLFAQYAAANRHPASAYAEGRVNRYPTTRPRRTVGLRPARRTASGTVRVNHLASATVRFVPKRLALGRKLALRVDMANRGSGSMAAALVYYRDGRVGTRFVRLSRSGSGHLRVPFATRSVRAVELTLVNANIRYKRCSNDVDGFSCGGVPTMDRVKETYTAKVR